MYTFFTGKNYTFIPSKLLYLNHFEVLETDSQVQNY